MVTLKKVSALLIAALLISGCGTFSAMSGQRTALQDAELAYVEASIGFDAAADVITAARSQGRSALSDASWAIFDSTQRTVAAAAPTVRAMLTSWRATGVKPSGFDANLAVLTSARDSAVSIQKGVSR